MSARRRRPWRLAGVLAAAAAAAAWGGVTASPAAGRGPLATIVQDDAQLLHGSDEQVAERMRTLRSLGVDRVRLTANWQVLAPAGDTRVRPSFDARDPGAYPDPHRAWANLDRAVREARAAGLEPMIDVGFWAPLWATRGDPGEGRPVWHIDPAAYGEFAVAVARRYAGDWAPRGEGPLPAVRWWTIWNEPNHQGFVQPQWRASRRGLRPYSAHLYRRLVRAAYPAIKGVMPDSTVLVGATSSTGTYRQRRVTDGTPPLEFLRTLACVDRRLRPLRVPECRGYAPLLGDGYAHHPYSLLRTPAFADPRRPDDARIGELGRLTRLLGRLAARRRVDRRLREVHLTEFGYETNPPDPVKPWSPAQQARWLAWAEYLAYSDPRVRSHAQFLLRDLGAVSEAAAARGKRTWGDWQSGLEFEDGTPKPARTSFRYTLHAACARGGRVMLWGRVRPRSGPRRLTVQALGGGRSRAVSGPFGTNPWGIFRRYARHRPGALLRLHDAGGRPLGLPVEPVGCRRR